MDLACIVGTVRPVHGGMCHLSSWSARVIRGSAGSVVRNALGAALSCASVSFLFEDGGRRVGPLVDRNVYPLRAFLGSTNGIVGLCVLHC